MSTEEISLVAPQNGINSQLLFQDDPLRFNCTGQPPQQQQQRRAGDPKTRELTGFIDDNKVFSSTTTATATSTAGSDRYFPSHHHHHHHHQDFPRNMYQREPHGTSGDDTDGEEDEDDEEDDEEEVDDMDGGDGDHENGVDVLVAAIDCNSKNTNCNNNNCSGTINNVSNSANLDKIGNGNGKSKRVSSSFGISGEMMKDGIGGGGGLGQTGNNAVTIAEADGEMYYSQYLQGTEGPGGGGKDMGMENGCGFSGRKEVSSFSSESGDSLRAILSDPVTGALMEDAMILSCGHSFGSGGMQHVVRMKVCYSCSQSISEDSIAPNLSLRAAVQAFRREEELQFYRSSKRRRERFDQDKGGYGDSVMDPPRGRGVQFPFAVTDRVIIKGNKRTPQRFVGREAVVTTQCLNGWYVVKTLDNAESVKLQYRSLAKVSDDPSSKTISTKIAPNWL